MSVVVIRPLVVLTRLPDPLLLDPASTVTAFLDSAQPQTSPTEYSAAREAALVDVSRGAARKHGRTAADWEHELRVDDLMRTLEDLQGPRDERFHTYYWLRVRAILRQERKLVGRRRHWGHPASRARQQLCAESVLRDENGDVVLESIPDRRPEGSCHPELWEDLARLAEQSRNVAFCLAKARGDTNPSLAKKTGRTPKAIGIAASRGRKEVVPLLARAGLVPAVVRKALQAPRTIPDLARTLEVTESKLRQWVREFLEQLPETEWAD